MSDNDENDGTVKFPGKPNTKKILNTVLLPVKPLIDYPAMLQVAYISVARQALTILERDPVPGKYNISITFDMGHPDVEAPNWIYEQYASIITIVLNERYDGLEVNKDFVAVTVYFRGKPANLIIPFDAITMFKDEIMNFAVGFGDARVSDSNTSESDKEIMSAIIEEVEDTTESSTAEIVSLDDFRKKD